MKLWGRVSLYCRPVFWYLGKVCLVLTIAGGLSLSTFPHKSEAIFGAAGAALGGDGQCGSWFGLEGLLDGIGGGISGLGSKLGSALGFGGGGDVADGITNGAFLGSLQSLGGGLTAVPVTDSTVNASLNKILAGDADTNANIRALVQKECVMDGLALTFGKFALSIMSDQIIDWINGGGDPQFVSDPAGYFKGVGDSVFDDYITNLGLEDYVCEPFKLALDFDIRQYLVVDWIDNDPDRTPAPTCTIDDVLGSFENSEIFLQGEFAVGGLRTSTNILLDEENNPITRALDIKAKVRGKSLAAEAVASRVVDWGDGFTSMISDYFGGGGDTADGVGKSVGEIIGNITTPGSFIADIAPEPTKSALEGINLADEVNEIAQAALSVLFKRVTGSFNGLTGAGSYSLQAEDILAAQNSAQGIRDADENRNNAINDQSNNILQSNPAFADQETVNLALRQPIENVELSTVHCDFGAKNAVDGVIDTTEIDCAGNVAKTEERGREGSEGEPYPWFQIDLGAEYPIDFIRVHRQGKGRGNNSVETPERAIGKYKVFVSLEPFNHDDYVDRSNHRNPLFQNSSIRPMLEGDRDYFDWTRTYTTDPDMTFVSEVKEMSDDIFEQKIVVNTIGRYVRVQRIDMRDNFSPRTSSFGGYQFLALDEVEVIQNNAPIINFDFVSEDDDGAGPDRPDDNPPPVGPTNQNRNRVTGNPWILTATDQFTFGQAVTNFVSAIDLTQQQYTPDEEIDIDYLPTPDLNEPGNYSVIFTATDSGGAIATRELLLRVKERNDE